MKGASMLLALATLAACHDGEGTSPDGVPVCEVGVQAPGGFRPLETFREEYADHVGVRFGFRDQRGRELHAFAGIPGEFGEGLPAAGEIELAFGRVGVLSGAGRVWVVEWNEGGSCDPRAALGDGFGREGFLAALEETGIAAGSG